MTDYLINTRAYDKRDKADVDALYLEADMGSPSTYDGITLAFDAQSDSSPGALAALVRVEVWNAIAYINPIIVKKEYQRLGIGKQLMDNVMAQYPEVRLVARGPAEPFYESLGFKPIAWDDIDVRYSEDCRSCPSREECNPVPMGWKA